MPTIDEILDQIRTGDYSTPDLDLALTQLENEITQSRSAYGQGFFEQAGAGLAEAGTFLAELPYKALGMEPTKTNIPTKVPTGFGEKAGRFAGEVIPEIAAEAALVAGTGGVGGVLPLAGQIMGSAGAGALMGAREGVGSAAAGAGIGAAVPFGFNKLLQKFGRKAGAEVLDLGEEQLQEVLQRTAARAQDPNNALPFEDLFMNEIGAARARQYVPRKVWPPVAPAEIDMTTGRLLPAG
ncbi:MAG: hypothetical protein ACYSWO_30545, partial [Planctomycetota bacterium]